MNNFTTEELWTMFDSVCAASRASTKQDVKDELARIAKKVSALANSKA